MIRVSWKGGLIELFRVNNRMPLSIKDIGMKVIMLLEMLIFSWNRNGYPFKFIFCTWVFSTHSTYQHYFAAIHETPLEEIKRSWVILSRMQCISVFVIHHTYFDILVAKCKKVDAGIVLLHHKHFGMEQLYHRTLLLFPLSTVCYLLYSSIYYLP